TAAMTATAAAPTVQSLARQFEQRLGQRRQQMERNLPLIDERSRATLEQAVDQPLQLLEQLLPSPTPTASPTPTRQPAVTPTAPPTTPPQAAQPSEAPAFPGAPSVGVPGTAGSASAGSGAPESGTGPPAARDEGGAR